MPTDSEDIFDHACSSTHSPVRNDEPVGRNLRAFPIFSPDQEIDAAIKLRDARARRWSALLAYSPLILSICKVIRQRLAIDAELAKLLKQVANSGEEYRVRRTQPNERKFASLCAQAGERLPDVDIDSELAELLAADIGRIASQDRHRLSVLSPGRMPGDSRPFRTYHEQVSKASVQVRRLTNEFAKANFRLVVSFARQFADGRLPFQDLIQEGNIGLLKAIQRFDHRRGFRFSTYASWWIRHSILRAIYNNGRQVRFPVYVHDLHQKLGRSRRMFVAQFGREPTLDELAAATGVDAAKLEGISRLEFGAIISLDAPTSNNEERTGVVLLEDEEQSPDESLEFQELANSLERAFTCLRPIEADILRRRFGLGGAEQETLREIGECYCLSRERIRQIQQQAINTIREELLRLELL